MAHGDGFDDARPDVTITGGGSLTGHGRTPIAADADVREHEELAAIRRNFDGEQIMAILDVPTGPLVGRTYKFLFELRPDRGVRG